VDDRFLTSADLNAAEHEDWAVVEAAQAEEVAQEESVVDAGAEVKAEPTNIFEMAEAWPALKALLEDTSKGHKEVASQYVATSETAVRRYRKANGIVFQKGGK
jgi:hypothetical protein